MGSRGGRGAASIPDSAGRHNEALGRTWDPEGGGGYSEVLQNEYGALEEMSGNIVITNN